MSIYSSTDWYLEHAKRVVFSTYGDEISYDDKNKDLLKFGRNALCNTTKTTVMTLPTGIDNETYVFQNLITTVSSDNTSDTQVIKVEGHTVGSDVSVSTLTQAAGVATCTTGAVHGHATDDWVYISGANEAGYNGVVQVTVTSTTIFTYTVDAATASPATGTILSTNQNLTFVSQEATLNGQNQVTLGTPLARSTRLYTPPQNRSANLIGRVYVYQNDTDTGGVPDTNTLVHLISEAGINNSEKCATTISSSDYWVVTEFYADCLEKTAIFGIVHFEVREQGGQFVNKIDISVNTDSPNSHEFHPYLIVPKNADVRIRISSSATNKDFSCGIEGVLAKIV